MKTSWKERLRRSLDNQYVRDDFVREQVMQIPAGALLLDAGAGAQRYRPDCKHLEYRAQDLGEYKRDEKQQLGDRKLNNRGNYTFGPLDYIGNIWEIDEEDNFLMRSSAPKYSSMFRFQLSPSGNSRVSSSPKAN